jgi:hypothetical protein
MTTPEAIAEKTLEEAASHLEKVARTLMERLPNIMVGFEEAAKELRNSRTTIIARAVGLTD